MVGGAGTAPPDLSLTPEVGAASAKGVTVGEEEKVDGVDSSSREASGQHASAGGGVGRETEARQLTPRPQIVNGQPGNAGISPPVDGSDSSMGGLKSPGLDVVVGEGAGTEDACNETGKEREDEQEEEDGQRHRRGSKPGQAVVAAQTGGTEVDKDGFGEHGWFSPQGATETGVG